MLLPQSSSGPYYQFRCKGYGNKTTAWPSSALGAGLVGCGVRWNPGKTTLVWDLVFRSSAYCLPKDRASNSLPAPCFPYSGRLQEGICPMLSYLSPEKDDVGHVLRAGLDEGENV